jgi:hypothetical protein
MRSDYTIDSLRRGLWILASTAAIVALFVLPMNAHALSCGSRNFSLSEAYDAADSIIVGLVTECGEEVSREPWAIGGSGCSFVSLDVLKESNSARDYRGVASSSGCGLSLQVGKQYLLFLDNENRPIQYSASLSGEQYSNQLSDSYQRILREFRDGVVIDLSEPWLFWEYEGSCTLSHAVGGHRIDLGGSRPGTHERLFPNLTREKVDGKTIYRGQTRSVSANSTSPLVDVEVVAIGDIPEYPIDAPMLVVSLQEQTTAPVRLATITVDNMSWQLYRVEEHISISGMPPMTQVSYKVGGEVSEQILSAMSKPSDVVVSAVLVNSPNVDSESPLGVSQLDEESVILAPQGDHYFSQLPPESGSVNPETTSSAGAIRAYGSRKEPPVAVLRLETRSTQLPAVLESYQACYEGVER